MSDLSPSRAVDFLASGGTADYTDQNSYPNGIDGLYANGEGVVNITSENGNTGNINVVTGAIPPVQGRILINSTTADLVIGIG